MNINIPAKIHNRFDIEVKDIITGKIVQRAKAENIILNTMFSEILFVSGRKTVKQIAYGKGTGDIAASRTTLFNELSSKDVVTVDSSYNNFEQASYVKYKVAINPGEYIGETFTEVGIKSGIYSPYTLTTHALIKDSEGNQISIGPKTDTQEITIYATLFATYNFPAYYDYVQGSSTKYGLSTVLLGPRDMSDFESNVLLVSTNKNATQLGIEYYNINVLGNKGTKFSIKDIVNKKRSTPRIRFESNEGNGKIWSLYLHPWFFRIVFPNTLWPGYHFEGKNIGSGNGITTKFILPWSDINTSKQYDFYIDGAKKTVGTDYTLANAENETSITFVTAPVSGVITGDWWVDYIPKDADHVLDITFTITFGEGA